MKKVDTAGDGEKTDPKLRGLLIDVLEYFKKEMSDFPPYNMKEKKLVSYFWSLQPLPVNFWKLLINFWLLPVDF